MVRETAPEKNEPINLLRLLPIKALIKHPLFPGLLQIFNLLVFLGLTYVGFYSLSEETRYTNLASFAIWVVWWPSLIFMVLFAARTWCTVCPLRWITDRVDRWGLQWLVPAWIAKYRLSLAIGLFAVHSAVISYEVDHVSRWVSIYMLILISFAVIVALLFAPKSFCNFFCPLNGFIGSYAKISPMELRSADPDICQDCTANSCLQNCPNNLYMGTLNNNESCLLCFECVKNCPNDNIRLSPRLPLQDLWGSRQRSLVNLMIVVVLLGIITQEVGEEWEVVDRVITFPADLLGRWGVSDHLFGYLWIESLWINLVLPLVIVMTTAGIAHLITVGREPVLKLARTYTPALVPLIFSLHFSKMWHKFNGNVGYGQYVIADPVGKITAAQIANKTLHPPKPLLMGHNVEGIFLLAIVTIGMFASCYVVYRIARSFKEKSVGFRSSLAFYFTTAFVGIVFLSTIVHWFGFATS